MFTSRLLLCSLLVIFAVAIVGCSRHAATEQNKSVPQATAETPSGLAELSVEDRELALKQGVCPVSGDKLGSMGKPFKTSVKGQTVFLCCQGCEQDLKDNPDKYLAKLKENEEKK